ncbi:hypothetical protein SADUNF_Sadunf18G0030400 [Salix dunnii]|uniref:Putative plant transposon protein domain-containing protein n=1 Tax=Salix dunnii TaxID=1413687 RepID=A0A835J2D0_9ROSI|nr:hypothetical protein SADUNF_Sadunf18G0030400 [Salix dunnii]
MHVAFEETQNDKIVEIPDDLNGSVQNLNLNDKNPKESSNEDMNKDQPSSSNQQELVSNSFEPPKELRSKQANDPTSSSGDNVQRFLSNFSNRAICVERGLGNDLSALVIDTLFAEMGWYSLYEYKKPTCPKLMRMFFANMRVNVEPRIISTLQENPIEFNCAVLADILGISNDGPRVFEIKIIPTIEGFIYDYAVALHTRNTEFAPGAKIKSQDLLLRPRLLHRIIAHNILPKKGHYDEVTFMELCLIDCMIQRRPINLPYIMIRNMILAYNKKQKALPYGQVFTTIFEHFDILLTGTDKKPYSDKTEIDTTTLTRMKCA